MARQRLDGARVIAAAADIADADGLEAVTLARVAAALGVRSPSLYNHVAGLDGLRRGIALQALRELGETLRAAATGRAGPDAVTELALAYRAYALAHPGRYALIQTPAADDAELAAAAEGVVRVVLDALRSYALSDEDQIHAARAFRAAVHGFVALEGAGGFGIPVDVDASFRRLVAVLAAGLAQPPGA